MAQCNPKVCDRKLDSIELGGLIRGMEKIYIVVEVPEAKKVKTGTF